MSARHPGEVDPAGVLEQARAALRSEPRIGFEDASLGVAFAQGTLTLSGEVANVAAKKLAVARVAALPAVGVVVDRVRVTPAARSGDGAVRHHVRDTLLGEPALGGCAVGIGIGARIEVVREADTAEDGSIVISVDDGVVTLAGTVPSLTHRRLAGALAWWVPGSRDVVNELIVDPPEEDRDDEVTDAVRLLLEKDPFVNASQIVVSTRDFVVTLEGLVTAASQRDMAEYDAWYVFGVDDVINHIEVRS